MPQIDHVFFFSQIIGCFIVNLVLLVLLIKGYGLLFSSISKIRSNFFASFEVFQLFFKLMKSLQYTVLHNIGNSTILILVLKPLIL